MAETTYYSALHYAKKAEKSAKEAAESAASIIDVSGKIIQLGFDGVLNGNVLTFSHSPGGVETPYALVDDYEYELDLAFSSTSELSNLTEVVIKNGSDTVRFVSALHRDATTNATVADMDAVMRYDATTGYRWLFKATYKITPSGAKVFLLYPVVAKEDTSKITNCITEIPQDIKLELNNGTLTLKAGSKVYVPNGKNADGSNRFDELVLTKDSSINSATATQYLICFRANGAGLFQRDAGKSVSGAGVTTKSGFAYDTELNLLRWYNAAGELQDERYSLPICIVTGNSSSVIETVDQVFNGFGYIGSTIFALPGVKGLIPNGWNADGSLKNIEFTTNKVLTTTRAGNNNYLYIDKNSQFFNTNLVTYDQNDNYNLANKADRYCCEVGFIDGVSGVITSFTPKLPFRAVDQNDFNKLDEEAVKTSGNQTIVDVKTFTNTIKSSHGLALESTTNQTTFEKPAETPTENKNIGRINFLASDSSYSMGHILTYRNTSNAVVTQVAVRQSIDGVQKACTLEFGVDKDGNAYTKVPTPPTSDNSAQIATTAFVNNKFQVVSALPSSPTAGVFYFIKE